MTVLTMIFDFTFCSFVRLFAQCGYKTILRQYGRIYHILNEILVKNAGLSN